MGVAFAGVLAACSSSGTPADGIGYVIDGDVPTYNVGSTAGQTSAARQAFARVQTGFSYPGPHGDAIADTDFGTITPVPGDPVSIEYQINPAAHYSDGAPVVCDDMVLAWAAHNGRFQSLFDAPVDPTMAAIEAIDCKSGQRTAVVHYSGDRAVTDWKSAFGAGSMLPSHVVSAGAGNVDIAAAVENEDVDALAPVADYWNTAFTLQPGDADQSVFVSSGPYRLDKVHDDGSIELIANEKWWGDPARTEHIMIHPRSASIGSLASDGDVDVVDIGAGSVEAVALGDGFDSQVRPTSDVEQLIFGTRGDLASADARRAVAACVPREQIAATVVPETDSGPAMVQNSRTTLPGTLDYSLVAGTSGGGYRQPDVDGARAALSDAGMDGLTVRVGYKAPDARRAQVVSEMKQACAPAGITIEDAGSAGFSSASLSDGSVDAVLGGTGGTQSGPPQGPATPAARLTALSTGASANIGGFSNPRIDEIAGKLAVTPVGPEATDMTREAEEILWSELPTLPLYLTPRQTAFATDVHAADPSASWAGAGWNMDRWMVLR